MVEHRRMRGRRIAGEDRLHHGGMFGVRARRASVGAELRAAEGREPATKAGGEAREGLVMRAGIDLDVEVDIRRGVEFAVVVEHDRRHRLVAVLQTAAFDRRHAHRREARAGRLHLRHRAEQLLELRGRRGRDASAAAGLDLDQAGRGEQADRLAHRRARHAEPVGERILVEMEAGREFARQDGIGDRFRQPVGLGHAFIFDVAQRPFPQKSAQFLRSLSTQFLHAELQYRHTIFDICIHTRVHACNSSDLL